MKIAIAGAWLGAAMTIAQPINASTPIARAGLTTCKTGAKAIAATARQIVGMTLRGRADGGSAMSSCMGPDSASDIGQA